MPSNIGSYPPTAVPDRAPLFDPLTPLENYVLGRKTQLATNIMIVSEIDVETKNLWHIMDRARKKMVAEGALEPYANQRDLRLLYLTTHAPDLFGGGTAALAA